MNITKRYRLSAISAFCFLLSAFLLIGCKTTPGTAPDAARLARVEALSHLAASVGGKAALLQNPEYRLPLQIASTELDRLITEGTLTGALLKDVLSKLPVKELKSDQAIIAIDAATTLFDLTLADKMDLQSQPYVLAAARGISTGLKIALQ